jgi:hypothetical protein
MNSKEKSPTETEREKGSTLWPGVKSEVPVGDPPPVPEKKLRVVKDPGKSPGTDEGGEGGTSGNWGGDATQGDSESGEKK